MKRKLALLALAMFMTAGLVSADYIQLYHNAPKKSLTGGSTLTIDFTGSEFQQPGLKIYVDATGYADDVSSTGTYCYYAEFVFTHDSIKVKSCYDDLDNDYYIQVIKNGASLYNNYQIGSDRMYDSLLTVDKNGTATVVVYGSGGAVLANVSTSVVGSLTKINFYAGTKAHYTVKSVTIARWSDYLTSLAVLDENTNSGLSRFDFADTNRGVRVYDPTNTYVAREYYLSPGSSLTAYLVNYYQGHWYTITAGGLYANRTLKVLRNLGGSWVTVADATLDGEGVTSVFLSDGALYKFQILDDNSNVLLEAEKTASPSDPTITLAGSLESVNMAVDPTKQLSWLILPADGFLYYNMTNNITVKFVSLGQTVDKVDLQVTGAVTANATQQFNSTSGEFSISVFPTQTNSYAYARITVTFSDGSTASYTRSFYVKDYNVDTNMTMLGSLKQAPQDLGLSQTGMVFVAAIITLLAAASVASIAGGRAAVPAAAMVWIIFAWAGWVDWRIVMISLLAGVGLLIRRGEA